MVVGQVTVPPDGEGAEGLGEGEEMVVVQEEVATQDEAPKALRKFPQPSFGPVQVLEGAVLASRERRIGCVCLRWCRDT